MLLGYSLLSLPLSQSAISKTSFQTSFRIYLTSNVDVALGAPMPFLSSSLPPSLTHVMRALNTIPPPHTHTHALHYHVAGDSLHYSPSPKCHRRCVPMETGFSESPQFFLLTTNWFVLCLSHLFHNTLVHARSLRVHQRF